MQKNKDIKEVVECFNMYQNDSDIDFLTIILDKKTDEVHTGYHINGYSDDLAECFSETIEQSPNFAQFIAKIIGRCSHQHLPRLWLKHSLFIIVTKNQWIKQPKKMLMTYLWEIKHLMI